MEEMLTVVTHQGDRIAVPKRITGLIASEGTQEIDLGDLDIDTESLHYILQYCQHHGYQLAPPVPCPLDKPSLKDVCDAWDVDFVNDLDDDKTLKLCLAAKALGIAPLVQLIAAGIAISMRQKDENELGLILEMQFHMEESDEAYLKMFFPWALTSLGTRTDTDQQETEQQ